MSSESENEWKVSIKQLALLFIFFLIGLVSALVLVNMHSEGVTTFSTIQLIGFVLSVLLSGASIVLAISAIALGKSSEQAIIRRNDESLKLQNEVFVKTTEALQRIESSTGVTEKRIEDIIAGRVGSLSQDLVELVSRKRKGASLDKEDIEKEIRDSLLEQRSPEEEERKKAEREAKVKRYEDFHQEALTSLANHPGIKAIKLTHGETTGEGEALFDGMYELGDAKIGMSAFGEGVAENLEIIDEYLTSLVKAMSDNIVNVAILIFDGDSSEKENVEKEIEEKLELFKGNPFENIKIILAEADSLEQLISELSISNK